MWYGCTQPLNNPRFKWCSLEQDPVRRALFRGRNDAEEPGHLAEVERGKRDQPPWRTVSHTQARCGAPRQRPHENNHSLRNLSRVCRRGGGGVGPSVESGQCCGSWCFSGSWIPDPTFFHPGAEFFPSRIRIKEFKYFNPWKRFLSSRKYDPSCSFRIPDLDPDFLSIPDPGVKKAPDPATLNLTLVFYSNGFDDLKS